MSTTLADYIVIRDTAVSLGVHRTPTGNMAGDQQTFPFEVPDDIVESRGARRPFITFFADPSSDAKKARLYVSFYRPTVAGHPYVNIFDYSYRGGVGRSHTEVFDTQLITWYSPVSLSLTRLIDDDDRETQEGTLYVSDIVIWFQRNVEL